MPELTSEIRVAWTPQKAVAKMTLFKASGALSRHDISWLKPLPLTADSWWYRQSYTVKPSIHRATGAVQRRYT